jgi:hypothetical protein
VSTAIHGLGLPALGAGLGGRVGVQWGPLRAAAYGMHWFRRGRGVVEGVIAEYRASVGGLELCGVLPVGANAAAFELLGCAEGEGGRLHARGLGAAPDVVKNHPWVALGAGLGAAWSPRPIVAIGLRADALAPLARYRFSIGDEDAGQVGPVDLRGALVVEIRLPATKKSTTR